MGCWSWSLPAGKDGSCPMESRVEGSICNSCYAQQNRYRFSTVRSAQQARLSYITEDPVTCIKQISSFIRSNRLPYFRVHDSGDFHKLWLIPYWQGVVRDNPSTLFWFPTRAWVFPVWLPFLRELAAEPNASVRPSAIRFGDPPPHIPGLSAGTMSAPSSPVYDCPKSVHGTSCPDEGCRTCWSKTDAVNYIPHGRPLPGRPVPLTIGGTPH